jgi:alkanesulfonate monooxygenase SsuD/methylene tetrahydromethanopterin reductase-like flavin-dependent oxidoreductase (luciferase family)
MRPLEVGLVLPTYENVVSGEALRWGELRAMAVRAEELGFDTVWVADELYWRVDSWPGPRGWWECVAITGAVAAATSYIKVGTWTLSNPHRNPTLTAKIVDTLDEISGGRFIFGLGAGNGGDEMAAFGYAQDHVFPRFEEAFGLMLSLIKTGHADHQGTYYRAADLGLRPRGPRGAEVPILLGARGPKMMRLAARHADIWSWYATEDSHADAFADVLADLDRACAEVGRDPKRIGRSIGVFVEPTEETGVAQWDLGEPIRGSAGEIANELRRFAEMGVTSVEIMPWPQSPAVINALGRVLEELDRG